MGKAKRKETAMRIKEKRKEWKVIFLTRRDLLSFTQKMREKYGECGILISPSDYGDEIAWIPKRADITLEGIKEVGRSIKLL